MMVMVGLFGRLFGKGRSEGGDVGVKVRPGTDYVPAPLRCPKCQREVSATTPERGVARCGCGHAFAVVEFEAQPLPKDYTPD